MTNQPAQHLMFLSVPGLRRSDLDPRRTPTLWSWANRGAVAEILPTFPCVTSCVQASMWTGTPPDRHGVIANGFFHRERHQVEFWVGRNDVVTGESVWDTLRHRRPSMTSAVWHGQNIKDAGADFIVTPAPIHEPDGSTKLWCYSKPDGLYAEMLSELGHFPLQHYWGPLASIESTRWILRAAARLHRLHAPHFHWIYIPHLDYAAQKFGPDSPQATASVAELDACIGAFAETIRGTEFRPLPAFVVVGEYALTRTHGVIYPNRWLREAGLLRLQVGADDRETVDLRGSVAFAMVDHQLAHVYLNAGGSKSRRDVLSRVVEAFQGVPGVAGVHAGADRAAVGLDHPRSGDVVLVSDDAHWFAYYWWLNDDRAPAFARTVDIHRKPGYDPVELYFDPVARGIPLDATPVKGSHGAPATAACQRTALISSVPHAVIEPERIYRDTDVKRLVLALLGAD